MTRAIRALLFACVTTSVAAPVFAPVLAQASQRGQPRTAFSLSDFARLKWIDGTWESTSPGETTIYQQYKFSNDSTVEISYFTDQALTHQTGTGRLYMSVGRVYLTFGPDRWGSTHIGRENVYFVPQVNAQNTFAWSVQSPDQWTSTQRSGISGRERVTVYQLRRIR